MKTSKQKLGQLGEDLIVKKMSCPKCQKTRTLKKLPNNFKCADIICDFCGFLAQVKASTVRDVNVLPETILGAAWRPQKERMDAGIYFSLFVVLVNGRNRKIYYLDKKYQRPDMFLVRKPLSPTAKRAGWQGFYYQLKSIAKRFVSDEEKTNF